MQTRVDRQLLEDTLDGALDNGRNAFINLVKEESLLPGEPEYLEGFREKQKLPLPGDRKLYASLLRRKLVVENEGYFVMRIPIIRRWIQKRWM